MLHGLVVTHGGLGRELIRVVELILGPVTGLDHVSNQGRSALELTSAIQDWLTALPADAGAFLLVDDIGGSCANAAKLACGESSETMILSGVNLALLLGFVTWRDSYSATELSQKLVEKGRHAIARIGPAANR